MENIRRELIREANEDYQQKLNQYTKKGMGLRQDTFNLINSIDPTSQNGRCGAYFDWLFKLIQNRQLGNDGNRWSQGSSYNNLTNALDLFNRSKDFMKQKGINPDINQYSYEGLMDLVNGPMASRQWDKGVQKFQGQHNIAYQNDNWVVVHASTWEAERFFGQHSQWCTVGAQHYYQKYNDQEKLFIIIPKVNGVPDLHSRDKWQCDISHGYEGSKETKFHCADITDTTYPSLNAMFRAHPNYYDEGVVSFLMSQDDKFKYYDKEELANRVGAVANYLDEDEIEEGRALARELECHVVYDESSRVWLAEDGYSYEVDTEANANDRAVEMYEDCFDSSVLESEGTVEDYFKWNTYFDRDTIEETIRSIYEESANEWAEQNEGDPETFLQEKIDDANYYLQRNDYDEFLGIMCMSIKEIQEICMNNYDYFDVHEWADDMVNGYGSDGISFIASYDGVVEYLDNDLVAWKYENDDRFQELSAELGYSIGPDDEDEE